MKIDNLVKMMQYFKDEDTAYAHYEKIKWNGNIRCPHCEHDKYYAFKNSNKYKCANSKCYKKFSVITNTMFENSKIPLNKWFIAIFLISSKKKGISSCQLARDLGVTQKTAWKMSHKIREFLANQTFNKLEGTVEADETYVGGKNKNKHYNKRTKHTQGRNTTDKVAVFGVMQRSGEVISMPVKDVSGRTLKGIIRKVVEKGSTIMTDEWRSYRGLSSTYKHGVCEHAKYQYVNGEAHTNNMECYWSHFKRTIIGTYHSVSRAYMLNYCKEIDFRYNTRTMKDGERFNYVLRYSINQ